MLGSSETIKSFMSDFYAKDANSANTLVKNIKAFLAKLADFFKRIAGQYSKEFC